MRRFLRAVGARIDLFYHTPWEYSLRRLEDELYPPVTQFFPQVEITFTENIPEGNVYLLNERYLFASEAHRDDILKDLITDV